MQGKGADSFNNLKGAQIRSKERLGVGGDGEGGSRWEGEVNYLSRGHGGRGDWNEAEGDISHGYPPESLMHAETDFQGGRRG